MCCRLDHVFLLILRKENEKTKVRKNSKENGAQGDSKKRK